MTCKLWKTTITIWTDYDPFDCELDYLCRESVDGSAYCTQSDTVEVPVPEDDPDWDGSEFFDVPVDGLAKGRCSCGTDLRQDGTCPEGCVQLQDDTTEAETPVPGDLLAPRSRTDGSR